MMPIEKLIISWDMIQWAYGMSREKFIASRIKQLMRRLEDVDLATGCLREA